MSRSRAEEILAQWSVVAHTAGRPASAPRPAVTRAGLPVGLLAAAGIVVILAVVLSPRGVGPGPRASLPAGAPPTATSGVTPSPYPSQPAPATASPSPTPSEVTQTPSPADTSAAKDAIDSYTAALVRGDFATAWAMLAPADRTFLGSLAAYAAERRAFFVGVAGQYTVVAWPEGVAPITDWLPGTHGARIDLRNAVLVEVDYPALAGNNAGYDLYIVDQGAAGPQIFDVR